jgi:VanZ family protein
MRILKAFWKPLSWAIIVLVLSTLSGAEVSKFPLVNIPNMDKVVHFMMYFIFTFLMMYDFARFKEKPFTWKQIITFSLLAAIAYGGMMELLQSFPRIHRSCDIKDFLANSVGAIFAVLLYKPLAGLINRVMALIIKPKNPYSL